MNPPIDTGWKLEKLETLVSEGPLNGYSPLSADDASGTLSLRLSATTKGHIILNENTTKRLIETIPPSSPFWLRQGDLLVQRSNTLDYLGSAAVFDGPEQTYVYPDLMMRLRFPDPVTTRWVWRYINTRPARDYFRRVAGGTAGSMPKISGEKLRNLMVPVPPLAERRRLCDILDKVDAIRRKRQEAIALTEQLLRSTFLEMFGDPVTNPKRWPTVDLGRLIVDGPTNGLYRPSSDYGSGTPIVRIDSFHDGEIKDLASLKRVRIPGEVIEKFGLAAGEILVNRVNSPEHLGKVALVPPLNEPTVFESNMMRLALDQSAICPEFLIGQMLTPYIKQQIAACRKDASNQSSINQEDVRGFQVRLPPIELQRHYRAVIAAVRVQRIRLRDALAQAEALFQSLVHRAFTAQL